MPNEMISVIPRELYLNRQLAPKPFPAVQDGFNFVFSARTRESKHFRLTAQLMNHLQHHFLGEKLKFYVFTPRTSARDLKKKFPILDWITDPILMGDRGIDWITMAPTNSIFINFSIDPLDDFNVSSAQAQELGWPLIVADRGPYKDISQNHVIYVPLDLLKPRKNGIDRKQLEDLSLYIISHWHAPTIKKMPIQGVYRPQVISLEEIQKYIVKMPENLKHQYETLWDRHIFRLWDLQ